MVCFIPVNSLTAFAFVRRLPMLFNLIAFCCNVGPNGTFVSTTESSAKYIDGPTLLYGTVSGAIGMVLSLTQPAFTILEKIQTGMSDTVETYGLMNNATYRSFTTDRKQSKARGVIDGDLVQRFLQLSSDMRQRVAEQYGFVVSDAVEVLETIARVY